MLKFRFRLIFLARCYYKPLPPLSLTSHRNRIKECRVVRGAWKVNFTNDDNNNKQQRKKNKGTQIELKYIWSVLKCSRHPIKYMWQHMICEIVSWNCLFVSLWWISTVALPSFNFDCRLLFLFDHFVCVWLLCAWAHYTHEMNTRKIRKN